MDPALASSLGSYLKGSSMGAGLGGIFSGLYGLFGGKNPADDSMQYLKQAQNQLPGYYQPYMQAGQGAMSNLQGQYGNLLNNPGGMVNQMGQDFHQSPGFNFALQNALAGANRASAAGGLAGSPASQMQNMGTATQMANQDYYNWLNHAQNMYGMGLQGEQGLANMGLQASSGLGDNMANILGNMAQMQYAGDANRNMQMGQSLGSLGEGLGSLIWGR